MNAENFNRLAYKEKAKFLNEHLIDKSYGMTNTLIFQEYTIAFVVSSNGKFVSATAYDNPKEAREVNKKLLKDLACVVVCLDRVPKIKNHLYNVYQRVYNLGN